MTGTARAGEVETQGERRPGTVAGRRRMLWIAAGASGIAVTAAGSFLGLWFLPFVCGLLIGVLGRRAGARPRSAYLASCVVAAGGWGAPLMWRALAGEEVASTAHAVAALAGLPPIGGIVLAVTLLIAVLQGLCGTWLGRSLAGLSRTGESSRK